MMDQEHGPDCKTYEIRLKGHLDETWMDAFGDFTLTYEEEGTTRLIGEMIDQSALHGVLKKIRDLGLLLLLVNCIEATEEGGMDFEP